MADSGDNFAQHTVGSMYDNGRGTEVDKNKAAEYYKLSAYQGNAFAQNNYSYCVEDTEEINWLRKSAEQGCALAQDSLGNMYREGEE